jgi:uncharacterized protein
VVLMAFKTYSALNHLFVSGIGASTPAEYARPGHVDETVVHDIAEWIASSARPGAPHRGRALL